MSTLRVSTIQNASSSTANLTLDASGNATVGNTLVMGSSFKRNRLINGNMQVWQRGTSFTASGANYYTSDRWQTLGQPGTYSQSTDVPSGFQYSLSIAASSAAYGTIVQRIEAVNCVDLVGQSATVSFYAKATVGGASGLVIFLSYANASNDFSATTTISSSTTAALTSSWTRYTATFTNLPNGVANGLQLGIFNAAGGVSTITYLITGVQLETGSVATPYEQQIYSDQLAQCYRYYWLIAQGNGSTDVVFANIYGWSTAQIETSIRFPVTMRTTPTIFQSSTANQFTAQIASVITWTTTNIYGGSNQSILLYASSIVGTATAGMTYRTLISGSQPSTVYLALSAEL